MTDLDRAFHAVRDRYDGSHPEPDAALRRALLASRARVRSRRIVRWVVIPLAATLAASTAWASATGRLAPAVGVVMDALRGEHAKEPSAGDGPSKAVGVPAVVASESASAPAPASATAPASASAPASATAPASASASGSASASASASGSASGSASASVSAPAVSLRHPDDPHAAAFEEAHRLHFVDRDPARALVAWDRYLSVAPDGRFAPEARYNRALTLVRVGRHVEAKRELAPFASGAYGEYRKKEASALLEALARDE